MMRVVWRKRDAVGLMRRIKIETWFWRYGRCVQIENMPMLTISEIRNDHDLDLAMARIEEIFDSPVGTPDGDELEALYALVRAYESEVVDLGEPDPIAAIEYRLDQQGLTEADLVPIIGSRDAVSELLAGKRKITKGQGEALHELLRVPMDLLLQIADAAEPRVSGDGAGPETAKRAS